MSKNKKNENKKMFVIFDILLLVLVIVGMMYFIFTILQPQILKQKTSNNVVQSYDEIRKLEECINVYYRAIVDKDYNNIKKMTYMFNRKTQAEYENIANNLEQKEDYVVKVKRAEMIENNSYRCTATIAPYIIENEDDYTYTIVLKLNPDNSTFVVLDDTIGGK